MTAEKRPHHHGDLRAALIAAGVSLVRKGGPDALSIRKAAALAGVSHAAPAYHFPSLADLRTAVIAQGYREFTQSMETELAGASVSPRDRILAAGRGYLRFALASPGLFHLMFGGSSRDETSDELCTAADAAYDVLRRISAPIVPGAAGAEGNEMFVWSLVHGLASLTLAKSEGAADPEAAIALYEAILPDLRYRTDPAGA